MAQALQRAAAANTVHYERRRPEDTTLYQLVGKHLETFLAQVEASTGAPLPLFVKDEFDAFLQYGIPRLRGGGAYRPTGFCGCAVPVARTKSWSRFRASGADMSLVWGAAHGADGRPLS